MKQKKLIEYYNRRAEEYEQIYYRDVPLRRKEIDDEAIRLGQLAKDKNILELACGTGYWTEIMAKSANSIIATDISAEMIEVAKKKNLNDRVEFVQSSLYELPFEPHSFDLLVLGFWFSHEPIQNRVAFFEILKTQIKPGGKIWMIDNNPPAEGPQFQSRGQDEHGNNYKQRFLDNGEEYLILKNYFTEESLQGIFKDQFKEIEIIFGQYYWSVVLA